MPAFAMILGLDAAFTLLAVIVGHATVPFTLPPTSLWLLGLELPIGAMELAARLFGFIGVSFAIAWGLRRWRRSAAAIERRRRQVDGLAVLSLVLFAIGIMSGVTEQALARPGYVAYAVALAFVANAGLQALGAIAFLWAGRRIGFTVGLMAGNRNMGLVLAALGTDAPPDIALFFAVAQLPMYMLPMLALPVYRRLMRGGA
jgi:BASS family bile acid:Na+ symporter